MDATFSATAYQTMTSALAAQIKLLDRSNWLEWSNDMTTFLRSQGLWQLVNGNEAKSADSFIPDTSGVPTTTKTPECIDTQGKWDNKDDQALGYMQLHMVKNFRDLGQIYTGITWSHFETQFGMPGLLLIFAVMSGQHYKT